MRLPDRIETARLVLRRPVLADAEPVFTRWGSDPCVTRYMSWVRHSSVQDSRDFIEFSDHEWLVTPGGPYVIEAGGSAELIGSCGFAFSGSSSADVGYILAQGAWGAGYATEALAALVEAATAFGSLTLSASVHPLNAASVRVLEKCGFCAAGPSVRARFPNAVPEWVEAARYVRVTGGGPSPRLDRSTSCDSDAAV